MNPAKDAVKRVKVALTQKFGEEGENVANVSFFEEAYELNEEDRKILHDTANMVNVLQRTGILTPRSGLMLMWAIGVEMSKSNGTEG